MFFFTFCTIDICLALLSDTNLYPRLQVAKGSHFGDVVYKNHCVHIAVVVFHHGFTEALLARCVPHLHLWRGTRNWKFVFCCEDDD